MTIEGKTHYVSTNNITSLMVQQVLTLDKYYSLNLLNGILPQTGFLIIIKNMEGCVFSILFLSLSTASLND